MLDFTGLVLVRFNPRSPRGGATRSALRAPRQATFQSTLPAWGSDKSVASLAMTAGSFQSTLPAWGSDFGDFAGILRIDVSIHAPRVGERHSDRAYLDQTPAFQSTLPAWGSDIAAAWRSPDSGVSIHAPRVGERRRWSMPQFIS